MQTTVERQVQEFMTEAPTSCQEETPLNDVLESFEDLGIRHMPVVNKENKPVGIISERDLRMILDFGPADDMTAKDLMKTRPILIWKDSPLKNVCGMMATGKIGSVIIVDEDEKIEGIFTCTDALLALSEIL